MPKSSSGQPRRRVHQLRVRVLTRPAPPPVEEIRPPVRPRRPAPPRPNPLAAIDLRTRVRIAWLTTILILAAIIVGWFAIVGSNLARPGKPNSLWQKIGANFRHLFTKSNTNANALDQELQQLEGRVFQDVPK